MGLIEVTYAAYLRLIRKRVVDFLVPTSDN